MRILTRTLARVHDSAAKQVHPGACTFKSPLKTSAKHVGSSETVQKTSQEASAMWYTPSLKNVITGFIVYPETDVASVRPERKGTSYLLPAIAVIAISRYSSSTPEPFKALQGPSQLPNAVHHGLLGQELIVQSHQHLRRAARWLFIRMSRSLVYTQKTSGTGVRETLRMP